MRKTALSIPIDAAMRISVLPLLMKYSSAGEHSDNNVVRGSLIAGTPGRYVIINAHPHYPHPIIIFG